MTHFFSFASKMTRTCCQNEVRWHWWTWCGKVTPHWLPFGFGQRGFALKKGKCLWNGNKKFNIVNVVNVLLLRRKSVKMGNFFDSPLPDGFYMEALTNSDRLSRKGAFVNYTDKGGSFEFLGVFLLQKITQVAGRSPD